MLNATSILRRKVHHLIHLTNNVLLPQYLKNNKYLCIFGASEHLTSRVF